MFLGVSLFISGLVLSVIGLQVRASAITLPCPTAVYQRALPSPFTRTHTRDTRVVLPAHGC